MNHHTIIATGTLRRLLPILLLPFTILIAATAPSRVAAQELTVERIDDYEFDDLFQRYYPISTMGVLRRDGRFVPFANQTGVGGWMPGAEDAPERYPAGTYWTFASYRDLNLLRATFGWLEFWWPDWQSTSGSGIIRVRYRGGSAAGNATNVRFGGGGARWRAAGTSQVRLSVPSIRRKGGASRSGSLRINLTVHRSTAVYTGRAGTVIARISYSPLPSGYYYPGGSHTTRLGRVPAGRLRSAMHLTEYTGNRRHTIADSRRIGGTVRFR